MHIVVCIKQVPDTTEIKLDPITHTLDRSSAPAILNPYDAHAVEEAVKIVQKYSGKVSVISMGPLNGKEAIKKCIEMGANAGYLLTDRIFAGSDTLATSYIISLGIKKIQEQEPIDLVFCGKQAIDGDTAQVGPGIARRMEMGQITYVTKVVEVNPEEKYIIALRKIDQGYEKIKASFPSLLTMEKEINELSFSSLPNMIDASRFEPVIWTSTDINPDISQIGLKGSPTWVYKTFPPPVREGGALLQGDDGINLIVNNVLASVIIARS